MNIIGIVAEYNPFHNGHEYLLDSIKTNFKPDGIICVMSGNFVQRGEPAIFNKWARTKMALISGVDLVVELPTCFATSTAEIFAESAIHLFNQTNVINGISFGVEERCKKELLFLGKLLSDEPLLYKKYLKKHLDTGINFANAREKAIIEYLENKNISISKYQLLDLLKKPNFILALEYTKAISKLNSKIEILPILRKGAEYHNKDLNTAFPSSTAIRDVLKPLKHSNKISLMLKKISTGIPHFCLKIIDNEIKTGHGPIFLDDFETLILYILRRTPTSKIANFFDVTEGLENRIKKAAKISTNINQLVANIKSKRYPETKIQRILIHIMLNIDRKLVSQRRPSYMRVLGLTPTGGKIIKLIKKQSDIPIITRAASYKKLKDSTKSMLKLDFLASDIYSLAYMNPSCKQGAQDFSNSVIFFDPTK